MWYATVDQREFFWVSSPQARHSRNLAVRPELAIVVFDSQQLPYTSHAVYISASAEQVPECDLDRGLDIFSAISRSQALPAWSRPDVESSAKHRLYHATAVEHFVLVHRREASGQSSVR